MGPHFYLSRVKDLDSFLAFVQALADEVAYERRTRDPYGPDSEEPEQRTLESFLNAALAWVRDYRRRGLSLPEQPSWQTFASLLFNGKAYEERGGF